MNKVKIKKAKKIFSAFLLLTNYTNKIILWCNISNEGKNFLRLFSIV